MSLHVWLFTERPGLEPELRAAVEESFPAGLRVAPLRLQLAPAVLPGELFRHGAHLPPRLRGCALDTLDPRGRTLHGADSWLAEDPRGPGRRGGLGWEAERLGPALSRRLGAALALGWSEDPSVSWASLMRQGLPAWSLAMGPRGRVVRFDGRGVAEQARNLGPEPDRAEAWAQGLARLLHAELPLDADERLVLPDLVREWMLSAEELPLG